MVIHNTYACILLQAHKRSQAGIHARAREHTHTNTHARALASAHAHAQLNITSAHPTTYTHTHNTHARTDTHTHNTHTHTHARTHARTHYPFRSKQCSLCLKYDRNFAVTALPLYRWLPWWEPIQLPTGGWASRWSRSGSLDSRWTGHLCSVHTSLRVE